MIYMQQEPGKTKDKYFRSFQIMTKFLSDEEKKLVTHISSSEIPLQIQSVLPTMACTILRFYLNVVKPGSAVNHPPSLFFMQLLEIKLEMYSCCDHFVLPILFPRLSGSGWGKAESSKARVN